MDKADARRWGSLILAVVLSVSLGTATAQAGTADEIEFPVDIPVLDGVDLTTQRDAALQEMLKINPDVQLPETLPPVDAADVVAAPESLDDDQIQSLASARSECRGQAILEGYRGGLGLFPFRASSYTDVRCAGPIAYSCRARVQARLAGAYRTVAIGPLDVDSVNRICQSSVNSGSFVRDYWRSNNTYTLVRYDRRVWGAPTSFCPIGSGTPVMRCYFKKTFRNGQRRTFVIF